MYIMPINLSVIGKEGRSLFRTWKKEQARYDTAKVRKEFKERDGNLDKYNAEIRSMNEKYRICLYVYSTFLHIQVRSSYCP